MDAVGRQEEGAVGGQQDSVSELVPDMFQVAVLFGAALEGTWVGDAAWCAWRRRGRRAAAWRGLPTRSRAEL